MGAHILTDSSTLWTSLLNTSQHNQTERHVAFFSTGRACSCWSWAMTVRLRRKRSIGDARVAKSSISVSTRTRCRSITSSSSSATSSLRPCRRSERGHKLSWSDSQFLLHIIFCHVASNYFPKKCSWFYSRYCHVYSLSMHTTYFHINFYPFSTF